MAHLIDTPDRAREPDLAPKQGFEIPFEAHVPDGSPCDGDLPARGANGLTDRIIFGKEVCECREPADRSKHAAAHGYGCAEARRCEPYFVSIRMSVRRHSQNISGILTLFKNKDCDGRLSRRVRRGGERWLSACKPQPP